MQFYTVRCRAQQNPSLDDACRIFQSMVRSAYNQLIHGAKQPEVMSLILERYGIQNYCWRSNAFFQAKSIINSQQELLSLHIQELNWKIGQVQKKMVKTRNPLKKHGYEMRIAKLEKRKAAIQIHLKNGTLPKVVFGGRKLIGSEEWCMRRRGQLVSVGDGWNKGNLHTRILKIDGSFMLDIRSWGANRESFTVPLHVPKPYMRIFDAIADQTLLPVHPIKAKNPTRPYTIRLVKRSDGNYDCYVSFEVSDEPFKPWSGERLLSVDINPTHVDLAIVNSDGNLLAAKSFKEPALIYARRNKRLWLASNLLEKAFKWASFFGVDALVIEDLNFEGVEHGRANRLIANFMRKKLITLAATKALRREWILVSVPAAYTSRVAEAKYKPNFPRTSVHQLAALVLGRRALGLQEHLKPNQLKQVAGCIRKRQAWAKKILLQDHGHPYLKPSIPTNGRMSMQDAKGTEPLIKRLTVHTRYAAKTRMQRLSWLMPIKHMPRRVEATRHDGWARAHRGSAPSHLYMKMSM